MDFYLSPDATPGQTPALSPMERDLFMESTSSRSPSRSRTPQLITPRASVQNKEVSTRALYNPDNWKKEYNALSRSILRKSEYVAVSQHKSSPLNSTHHMRLACCVRPLPTLNDVKSLLRGQTTSKVTQIYDSLDGGCVDARGSKRLCREDSSNSCCSSNENPVDGYYTFKHSCILNPSLWMVEGDAAENTIFVVDAVSGRRLLRIRDPKMNVPVTAMMHAPFRGYMNRNVQVIPIRHQEDILRLKQSKLIETDYVWVGLSDGSIRLFLANCNRVRESDRSAQMSRGELADLVFELPKYHTSSIVSIARSPCHRDEEGFNQTTAQRPSSAVEYATAASRVSQNEREHLSLMCSASVDSSIVIWDVRTIYIAIEKLRQERKLEMERGSYRPSFATADVVTIEGFHPSYTVRSGCVLVKVRPVMKLKGGIVGLRTLNWISTVVTTEGYQPRRDAGLMTRDAEEMGAPDVVKERPMKQIMTRFERREEHRRTLGISEWEMQEIEEELRTLLPPLAKEPAQSIRINLLVAGDGSGVIHVWNLDEELKSRPISHGESLSPSRSPARSISPEKSAWSASSPSVRLSGSGPGVAPVKGLKKNSKKERGSSSTPSRKSVGRASMGRSSNRLSSETPNRSSTKGSRTEGKSFPLSSAKAKREGSQGVSKSSASPSATAGPVRKTPKKVPLLSKASSGGQAKSGAVRKTADPGPRKTVVLTTDVSPQPVPRAKSKTPSKSPGRGSTVRRKSKKMSSVSPSRPSTKFSDPTVSPQRSPSRQTTQKDAFPLTARTAMCKLEFTEGAAVNGIGVELPSTIVTTLRRIPDAKERLRSLLEDPTPEEVEQRFLENSFEELTEEKALYFVFQQLQMYVAVEGTVLNIRCLPEWQMADEDGRTLFKERQFSSGTRSKRGGEESVVGSALKLSQFSIYFRKLVLEAHSQPVTNLYMDNRSRYIWLSRNDGLLSIFSMDSKRIITKIPHPCAECAVVAGSYTSWLREQEEYRTQLSDAKTRPKLEWHRETRHFPQSHFTSVVPFLKSTRPVFMLMTKTKTASATSYRDSMTYEDSLLWNFGSMLSNSSSVWSLDARQSLEDSCVTMRENNMSLFIDELRWVRDNADVVRKAQKEYYEQSCENIVQKVAIVINQLGEYTRLPALYKAFYTWLESITVFPRQHVMRTDRSRRLQRTANLLHTFQRTTDLKRLGYFYLLWDQYTDQRRMEKELVPVKETCKQLRLTSATRPTPEMMQQMYEMNLRRETFFGWLRWRSSLVSPSVSRMASLDRSRSRGGSISRAGSPLARTNTSKFIRTRTRLPSISLTSNVPPPQTVEVSSAPSLKELSHHTVPLDTLFLMLQNLWNARPFIMKFRFGEGESVLDESWLSLIESAEASAESDTDLGKRAAVFSYGLLPLLQGLLSSADEVLPTLGDPTVCKEVMSLLNGIELCLDYIAADAEQLCVQLDLPLTAQKAPPQRTSGRLSGTLGPKNESGRRSGKYLADSFAFADMVAPPGEAFPIDAVMQLLHHLVPDAVHCDQESINAAREIMGATENFDAFILFVTGQAHKDYALLR